MPVTHVALLDAPTVCIDGQVIAGAELGGRRAVVCLAVLAMQAGRSVSREVLADAVWEEQRPASWRANLRAVISDLRRTLGDAIIGTSDGYQLAVGRDAVDVLVLEQHAALAESADPATAWELTSAALPPAGAVALRGFDSAWSDRLRGQVAEARRRLLGRAAQAALQLGRARDAEPLTRELVAGWPLREEGHRLLMEALAAAGNRADALAAYDDCRRLLDEHLAAAPSPRTQAVFLKLLRASPQHPAVLRPDGTRPPRPVAYQLSAARLALASGVFEDAARAAAAGLAALDGVEHETEEASAARASLEVILGAAQHHLGDPAGAVLLRRVAEDARDRGDGATLADAALAFTASEAAGGEAALDETLLDLYREALDLLGPHEETRRIRLQGRIGLGLAWRSDHAAGRAAAMAAVSLAEANGDLPLLLSTLSMARQTLTTGTGSVAEKTAIEVRLADVAAQLDDPAGRAKAAMWAFETAVCSGDGDRLEALLEAAERAATDVRAPAVLHPLAYTRAALALLRGDLSEAASLTELAASYGRRAGLMPHITEALRLVQLVPVWEATGRLAAHRDELVGFFGAPGLPEWSSMVAIAEAAVGDHTAARTHLTTFVDNFEQRGPSMICPVGLVVQVAQPIAVIGDADLARRLHALLAPYVGQGAYIAHFVGPVDTSLGLLARTVGDRTGAVAHFRAAERFAVQLGAPLHATRARVLATATRAS